MYAKAFEEIRTALSKEKDPRRRISILTELSRIGQSSVEHTNLDAIKAVGEHLKVEDDPSVKKFGLGLLDAVIIDGPDISAMAAIEAIGNHMFEERVYDVWARGLVTLKTCKEDYKVTAAIVTMERCMSKEDRPHLKMQMSLSFEGLVNF
ncbi:MAG: hypothetical protein V1744_05775 [Candidatus Altiarchaeota archaeon]